mmetsp:Transcript_5699/g.16964  ORF Transcript_5699/g.16964 Transcript_5699/m.16964 type:complete len:230 (-) Transcript_5699:1386-2075(-)
MCRRQKCKCEGRNRNLRLLGQSNKQILHSVETPKFLAQITHIYTTCCLKYERLQPQRLLHGHKRITTSHFQFVLQIYPLLHQFLRQARADLLLKCSEAFNIIPKTIRVHSEELLHALTADAQSLDINIFKTGQQSLQRLFCVNFFVHPLHDPFEHPDVVPKTRPEELAIFILVEPVDKEELGGLVAKFPSHIEPMPKVVAHVVPTEGKHCHRVDTKFSNFALCGCSLLR